LVLPALTIVFLCIDPEEIGVLAPYKSQVRAIRELLRVAKLSDISVGPVEQFQGQVRRDYEPTMGSTNPLEQERKVIILATTRSNEESHPVNGLGFLINRQRTNGRLFSINAPYLMLTHGLSVAITRAQALLIVIGDPEVLRKDQLWRIFLNYIESRKGWTGKMHSWKPDEAVHLPEYEIVPEIGGVMYGEEFIGGKSEKIRRSSEGTGG
jgi:helicase MOV-10